MRQQILSAVASTAVALAIPVVMQAQTKTPAAAHADFSGTWVLEHVQREGGGGRMGGGMGGSGGRMGGGRRGGGGGWGGGGMDPGGQPGEGRGGRQGGPGMEAEGAIVTITQTPDRLIVTRSGSEGDMITYALNGSEAINPGPRGGRMKSKAKWEGPALVVENKVEMQSPRGSMEMKMREVRSLSADGRTMTVRVANDTPMGKMTREMTWRRKSADGER